MNIHDANGHHATTGKDNIIRRKIDAVEKEVFETLYSGYCFSLGGRWHNPLGTRM
jgi:hypothetical protein